MAQNQNMTERARQSMEKAAYVAVGAPTAALKALSARVSDLRDVVKMSTEDMSADLAREIDEWVAQGEEVIENAMKRFRESNVADELRTTARSTRKAARVGIDKATGATDSPLDVVDPDESLTAINGIGPRYADQLGQAGVVGVSSFLDRTNTRDDIAELATASGFSEETIEDWRGQVDLSRIQGVGESYQLLLHRIGVWTVGQLADVSPAELAEEMRAVELPDAPDQIPSASVIRGWRDRARRLDATS